MCTKSELNAILKQIIEVYHTVYGNDIVKIVLYGSYARGDYEKDSDIDIVAIVQGKRAELQQRLKRVWEVSSELELEYGTIISPTIIPFEEFEKFKDDLPYYKNILNEGVNLVA